MNISKKSLFTIIAIVGLATAIIAYALPLALYDISSNVSIAGIGIEVNWNIEDSVGPLVTAMDFGTVIPPLSQVGYLPGNSAQYRIVLVADCNGVSEAITWNSTLNSTIGSIEVQIERNSKFITENNWEWISLSDIVMSDFEVLGFRPTVDPEDIPDGAYGHIRILLQTLEDAPHGDFTFTITFIGTQI